MRSGDLIGTGNVTVTTVIKPRSLGAAGFAPRIVDNNKFLFGVDLGQHSLLASSTGASPIYSANNSIAIGSTYVVSVTRDSSGVANFFINGLLSGTQNQSSGTPQAGSDTYIGNRADNARQYNGFIGPVMIHNSILDPASRNALERTLGAKYGITVTPHAPEELENTSSSIYPAISTKSPLEYATVSSLEPDQTETSPSGLIRYQVSTDATAGNIDSAAWYYYSNSPGGWAVADKNNPYMSNTATEINTNISTLSTDVPVIGPNSLKWRAFFITDGIDNPVLQSINAEYIADSVAPDSPAEASASAMINDQLSTINSNSWYNATNLSFSWNEPTDTADLENGEYVTGIKGYYIYFGESDSADPTSTSGLIGENSSPVYQTDRTINVNKSLVSGTTYYLIIAAMDNAGNVIHEGIEPQFVYKYDSTAPTNVNFVTVSPAGCSTATEFTMTWNKVEGDISNIAKYQYNLGKRKDNDGNYITVDIPVTDPNQTEYSVSVKPYADGDNIFYVWPIDTAGNAQGNWQSGVFCKTGFVEILDGPTVEPGPSSIKVSWTSSKKTTGQVEVKDGDTYREPQGHRDLKLTHDVSLNGLKSEKMYSYRLIWRDEAGNEGESEWYDIKTAAAPAVKDPEVSVISPSKAIVSWSTNYITQSQLEFGIGSYDATFSLEGQGTNFTKELNDLKPGSGYNLRIKATTLDGAESFTLKSFTTPPLPSISSLRFEPVIGTSRSTYKATWTTNIDTSSAIYYKKKDSTESYTSKSNPDMVKDHEIIIDNLEDQSEYTLYAQGRDQYGNEAKSDTNTIVTPLDSRPPKLSNLTVEVKSSGFGEGQKASIIATWETDELTTSQIEYSQGIQGKEYAFKSKEDSALSTSHAVILSELEPSKIYHLRAVSKDRAGNQGFTEDTTVITGKIQKSVIDIIVSSLQRSLGWIFTAFK